MPTPRKYVTQTTFENAIRHIRNTGEQFEFQFSPAISIRFGVVILTISKYYDHHIYHKRVTHWMMKSHNEINREIAEQEWKR